MSKVKLVACATCLFFLVVARWMYSPLSKPVVGLQDLTKAHPREVPQLAFPQASTTHHEISLTNLHTHSATSDADRADDALNKSTAFAAVIACHLASRRAGEIERKARECETSSRYVEGADYFRHCVDDEETTKAELERLRLNSANCPKDRRVEEATYFAAVRDAAEIGNVDAQMCFLQGDFIVDNPSASDISHYASQSQRYLQFALLRGDWRVAVIFSDPVDRFGGGVNGWNQFIKEYKNDATAYAMNRLLELGSDDSELSQRLQITMDQAAAWLSPNELAQADVLAQQTFTTYFANAPRLHAMPEVCGASGR